MIQHVPGLLFSPGKEWQKIAPSADRATNFLYVVVFAILPAVAWYHGTSSVGWSVGDGDVTRLTPGSALRLIVLFYVAMLSAIAVIGYFIHWMAGSYDAESTLMRGISVAGYTATPMFLAGAVGFFPDLWLALLLAIASVSWSLHLLYTGIPVVMKVPQERGFLFASAVVAICLVILIAIMCISVILWDMGFAPVYTN